MSTSVSPLLVAACRTPIGRFLGGLAGQSAVGLGTLAAKEALARARVDPLLVDEAIIGNVLSAGLGQAPARQVALGAGLPPHASALTINMVCGSGLRAVMLAAEAIAAGESQCILAGGMESMSNAPHLLRGARSGWKIGEAPLIDHLLHDGLVCAIDGQPMGIAAEHTASVAGLERAELDAYSLESHQRAVRAQQEGAFGDEIVPVVVPGKKGDMTIATDEGPRADTTLAALARLSPSFRADGVITAGNSSQLSDGAAMLVVTSADFARAHGLAPLARIVASATAGRVPRDLFFAPIDAVRRVAQRAGMTLDQIDLFEINEAFAAQAVADLRALELDPARVNVHGGAIALGHPIGASGARTLATLLHSLARHGKRFGCAALCLGGGNAVAMIVERFEGLRAG
jgi:acetyl-CoA C-acetyltransferase